MIEMNKEYRTRDGRAVRILCIDCQSGKADYPVVGLIREPNGLETIGRWGADGSFQSARAYPQDLVPVPVKHDGWLVIQAIEGNRIFSKKELAEVFVKDSGCWGKIVTWERLS